MLIELAFTQNYLVDASTCFDGLHLHNHVEQLGITYY
jgi:hypothetical protein